MNDINENRLENSYASSIQHAAALIAFNPEKIIFYGSASKKAMFLSASDIDLIEPINSSKADELSGSIKQIVQNIDKTKLVYLGDFKSGIDENFVTNIGHIKGKTIIDFDKKKIKNFVQNNDFDNKIEILLLLKQKITIDRYFELEKLMRPNQILRWSHDELIKGFKVLNGKKLFLQDTIKGEGMTKLDTIQWIETDSRFVEITNYFKLSNDKIDFDVTDYVESLKNDILKTYYSGNLFKMIKRILSFSMLTKDMKTANKLYKIVNSGLGILYKVISDIKTIIYLLEHYKSLPNKHIESMIDGFKSRIGSIYEFTFHEKKIMNLIDKSKINFQTIYILLEQLYKILIEESKKELKKIKFYPLPLKYYPK